MTVKPAAIRSSNERHLASSRSKHLAMPRQRLCKLIALACALAFNAGAAEPASPAASTGLPEVLLPYLQNPTADGMTVCFLAQGAAQVRVGWALDAQPAMTEVAATPTPIPGTPWTVWKARLAQLERGALYQYRVCYNLPAGGAMSPVYHFRTLDPQAKALRFAAFNDLHSQDHTLAALLRFVKPADYEFSLLLGDCIGDPGSADGAYELFRIWNAYLQLLDAANKPIVFIRGNHETRGDFANQIAKLFDLPRLDATQPWGNEQWQFTLRAGPVDLLAMDTGEDECDLGNPLCAYKRPQFWQSFRQREAEWLQQLVATQAAEAAPWQIFVSHLPLYNNNEHFSVSGQQLWEPILQKTRLDLMLAGHDHGWKYLPRNVGSRPPWPVLIGGGPSLGEGTVMLCSADESTLSARLLAASDGRLLTEFSTARNQADPGHQSGGDTLVLAQPELKSTGVAQDQTVGRELRSRLVESLLKTSGGKPVTQFDQQPAPEDWLIQTPRIRTTVQVLAGKDHQSAQIMLANGLISRTFLIADASLTAPGAATMSFKNLRNGAEFVRSIRPEVLMTVNGKEIHVGGLLGQPVHNYFDRAWIDTMSGDANALGFVGCEIGEVARGLPWQARYGAPNTPWPPMGKRLTLRFQSRDQAGLQVAVHYEMYDGIPLLCKQVVVTNAGTNAVMLEQMATEILAVPHDQASRLWIESDYTFYKMTTTRWEDDPLYTTYSEGRESIEDLRYLPNSALNEPWKKVDVREYSGSGGARYLLSSRYSQGLAKSLKPGEAFTSFRTYEIPHDGDDAERQGLARRKMFRTVAPWTQENPVFMHLRNSDSESIRRAVDQCVETGFEMIILTFGSGFNMESTERKYWERIKADFDYAHSKGIRMGGYILFCSTASKGPLHDAKQDVYPPSLCLGSEFVDGYFNHLYDFMEFVGQDIIETDGPYHGYPCEATDHKYHQGRDDSFRVQWEKMTEFFHGCRQRGIYVNAPDNYFHHGSNKTGMGYREENWSLPRDYQVVIGRQNIYDGTWRKLPSMGWMMTPLVEYHGGGPAATLEPLKDHLAAYGAHLAQNFGSGVQSCYRGPRLYDAEETRMLVKNTVTWYNKYRAILDSDIIHVRRPDGQDIDCMLHVNPALKQRGLAMVYNPLAEPVQRTLQLPLYYTGLTDTAQIREQEGPSRTFRLDREFNVAVPLTIPANGYTWLVIE